MPVFLVKFASNLRWFPSECIDNHRPCEALKTMNANVKIWSHCTCVHVVVECITCIGLLKGKIFSLRSTLKVALRKKSFYEKQKKPNQCKIFNGPLCPFVTMQLTFRRKRNFGRKVQPLCTVNANNLRCLWTRRFPFFLPSIHSTNVVMNEAKSTL